MVEFVTIGETCAVFAAKYVGRMRYCTDYEIRPGGSESTVAAGVSRLGHTASWVSRLGDDELGRYLLSFIRGEGVDVSNVSTLASHPTGVFVRERLPRGRARHFYYRTGSAFSTMGPQDLPFELIAQSRMLHLTGITPALSASNHALVVEAVKFARQHGVPVLFDPNIRRRLWTRDQAQAVLEPIMAQADYVLPGLDDLQGLYRDDLGENEAVAHLRSLGCRQIILKLGAQGALVVIGDKQERVECVPVADPIDLMGAGDAFAAGFAVGLLEGKDAIESAIFGNAVAGISVETPGNIESLPTIAELHARERGDRPVER